MTRALAVDLGWAGAAECAGLPDDQVPVATGAACPVRVACLEHALVGRIPTGTWGGYTTDQRAELLTAARGDVAEALIADHHRHQLTAARRAATHSPHPHTSQPQQLPLF